MSLVNPWELSVIYLFVLLGIVTGSIWLEFVLRTRVTRRWRRLLVTLVIAIPPFLLWDWYAVAQGHWTFAQESLVGIAVGPFPIEEVLFFPVVGFAAILTLEAVRSVRGGELGDGV